jgi:hypothetical protein
MAEHFFPATDRPLLMAPPDWNFALFRCLLDAAIGEDEVSRDQSGAERLGFMRTPDSVAGQAYFNRLDKEDRQS